MAIDKNELIEFLKENLTISVSTEIESGCSSFDSPYYIDVKVTLSIANEEISTATSSFSLPSS